MLPLLMPLLVAQAAPAAACAAPAALPAALAGWRSDGPVGGIGRAFAVAARDPAAVRGLVPSAAARGGRAALVPIEIRAAGTYRIALSDAGWIDVARDGTVLASAAHAHGPPCSGIRKIVDFALAPGRYTLQLSGIGADRVRVLIVRG